MTPRVPVIMVILSTLQLLATGMRRGSDHVYSDSDLIQMVDPHLHGFSIILTDETHQFLIVNPLQLPTIYVTAIPLDGKQNPQRLVLFKDGIQNQMVKISDLPEKSWYFVCLEFETISIGSAKNESTGTECRIYRTLDKSAKRADHPVLKVEAVDVGDTFLSYKLSVDTNFPLRLTTYLKSGGAPSKAFIIERPNNVTVRWSDLQPDTDYGPLCTIEEPLVQSYTAMGRAIQVRNRRCHSTQFDKTLPKAPHKPAPLAQMKVDDILVERFVAYKPTASGAAQLQLISLISSLLLLLVVAVTIL